MTAGDDLMAALDAAERAIYDAVGFDPNQSWRLYPIEDYREHDWTIARFAEIAHSDRPGAVARWLEEAGEWAAEDEHAGYEASVVHVDGERQGIYRGAVLTGVVMDTHCDGNVVLGIFLTNREVKP